MSNEIGKNVVAFDNEVIKAAVESLKIELSEKVGIERLKQLQVFKAEFIKEVYKQFINKDIKGSGIWAAASKLIPFIDDVQRGLALFFDLDEVAAEYQDLDNLEKIELSNHFNTLLVGIPTKDEKAIEIINTIVDTTISGIIQLTVHYKGE